MDANQDRALQAAFDGYVPAAEMAAARAEIERLQAAKRRALAIADERAKESIGLRAENERLQATIRGFVGRFVTPAMARDALEQKESGRENRNPETG